MSLRARESADSIISRIEYSSINKHEFVLKLIRESFQVNEPVIGLYLAQRALEISQKMKKDSLVGISYEYVGINQRLLGNNNDALLSFYKALKVYKRLGMSKEISATLLHLADTYSTNRDFKLALEMYSEALPILEKYSESSFIICKINLAETYRKAHFLDSATKYLNEVLESEYEIDSMISAYARGNLGMVYHSQDLLDRALTELDTAMFILTSLEDYYAMVTYDTEIGQIMIKQGKVDEGFTKIEEALKLAQTHQLKEQARDISQQLSALYADYKQYDKAYVYQKIFQVYQDSIVNADNIRSIEQTRAQYEIDQKEAERLQAEQERDYVLIIGGLVAILAVISLVAFVQKQRANRSLRQKNEIIAQQAHEKELLHREMHHRVKNNLQLISSIMGLQARSEKDEAVNHALSSGRSRMEAMTLIHQNLYQEGQSANIQLDQYLERLTGYLKTTYRGEVKALQLEVEPLVLKADDSIPIGLIINEAICNAVKYRADRQLTIHVHFGRVFGRYHLVIRDDGPGFDETIDDRVASDLEDAARTGFGTQLIRTLAQQMRAQLDIRSGQGGTEITLAFNELQVVAPAKLQQTA